ncbi:AVR1 protein, partial [Turnix velox]|nr:AVR1 protein [Turnix velox]
CNLTGRWANDLGSNMTIGPVSNTGKFEGSYFTAVADSEEKIVPSPMIGFQ